MTGARGDQPPEGAAPASLIVLNNDAIVCDGCYEPQDLELDPGLIPWARITSGLCGGCGAEVAGPPPQVRTSG